MNIPPVPLVVGRCLPGNWFYKRLLAVISLLACWLGAAAGAPLPPTDNTSPPYMGLYGWGLDNANAGEGMSHIAYTASWLNRSGLWAEDFNATDSWGSITSVWPYKRAKAWLRTHPGTYISTVGMLPPGATLANGAAGNYNSHWTTLAQNIVSQGIVDNTIIRLGHEFNGNWYTWSCLNQAGALNYAEYFRKIVTTMRAVPGAANLRFCWNGNIGWTGYSVADAYPGDAYVDYIGVDIYDQSWATNTYPYTTSTYPYGADALTRQQNAWNSIAGTANYGLAWWKNFAASRGKPLTIPEWGSTSREDTHGGLDNPYYIQKMYDFIQEPANNVAWHVYFDVNASDGGHQLTQLPGRGPTQFPNAAALFRRLFGVKPLPNGADIGTVGLAGGGDAISVTGAGAGYLSGGTSDSFHFAHGDAASDDMMVAKITSMASGSGPQSGLMLRQGTAANAPYAALYVKNGSCVFQSRASAGGAAVQNFVGSGATAPIWLKLVRRGTAVTGYRSADGRNWTYAGGATVTLSGTAKLGIAVSSGSTTSSNVTGVDSVDDPSIAAVDPGITSALMMDVGSTLAPGITTSGSWSNSGTETNHYGGTQKYNWAPGTATAMRFRPTITTAGLYEVYLRWWQGAGHQFADCMPITMTSAGGAVTNALVNQKVGTGLWNYVGTYNLATGTDGNLYLSNTGCQGDENGYLRVDGAMFVPLPAATGSAPGPVTSVTKGATTSTTMVVNWGTVAGATGYEFSWNSSVQGYHSAPTTNTTYSLSGLVPNTWYWIRVRATNAFGAGPWTDVYSFQTAP
jgi:hypothetical protein